MNTYLFGYSGGRLTLDEMATRQTWAMLHPEFRRRLMALFDAGRDVGRDVGIGEGWRSSEQQERVFLQRHVQVASGGCCGFDGKRWQLRQGMAHAAPPFRSYHESVGMPSGLWALAADLVGDVKWANANADRFGLRHFAQVNDEPWHHQPSEVPVSRSNYDGRELDVEEVDMMVLDYRPGTPGWIACLWTGDRLSWIVDGHADAVLRTAGVRRVVVDDAQLLGVINSSVTKLPAPTGAPKNITDAWKKQAQ